MIYLVGDLTSKMCDIRLVFRQAGKLPGAVESVAYVKEYGTDEFDIQVGAVKAGQNVVMVDDLLATVRALWRTGLGTCFAVFSAFDMSSAFCRTRRAEPFSPGGSCSSASAREWSIACASLN